MLTFSSRCPIYFLSPKSCQRTNTNFSLFSPSFYYSFSYTFCWEKEEEKQKDPFHLFTASRAYVRPSVCLSAWATENISYSWLAQWFDTSFLRRWQRFESRHRSFLGEFVTPGGTSSCIFFCQSLRVKGWPNLRDSNESVEWCLPLTRYNPFILHCALCSIVFFMSPLVTLISKVQQTRVSFAQHKYCPLSKKCSP